MASTCLLILVEIDSKKGSGENVRFLRLVRDESLIIIKTKHRPTRVLQSESARHLKTSKIKGKRGTGKEKGEEN
jgi:hypothetical protein